MLTRVIPARKIRKSTAIRGVLRGVLSGWVYNRLEAACEGVIDFKLEEVGDETKDLIRIRSMQDVAFDRRWHKLRIAPDFEVTVEK